MINRNTHVFAFLYWYPHIFCGSTYMAFDWGPSSLRGWIHWELNIQRQADHAGHVPLLGGYVVGCHDVSGDCKVLRHGNWVGKGRIIIIIEYHRYFRILYIYNIAVVITLAHLIIPKTPWICENISSWINKSKRNFQWNLCTQRVYPMILGHPSVFFAMIDDSMVILPLDSPHSVARNDP